MSYEKVGDRMQNYYCLTEDNYKVLMRQYGRKRGCVEFEYLMVVFGRLAPGGVLRHGEGDSDAE